MQTKIPSVWLQWKSNVGIIIHASIILDNNFEGEKLSGEKFF